jgi:hypothetical protein
MKRLLFLSAAAVLSTSAYAKTGNFMPMLLSFFVGVPALLLVPVIGIAVMRPGPARKRPWIVASMALAVLSFGSLWWVVQTFSLLASNWWESIYLWTVPGFILWVAFWRANR